MFQIRFLIRFTIETPYMMHWWYHIKPARGSVPLKNCLVPQKPKTQFIGGRDLDRQKIEYVDKIWVEMSPWTLLEHRMSSWVWEKSWFLFIRGISVQHFPVQTLIWSCFLRSSNGQWDVLIWNTWFMLAFSHYHFGQTDKQTNIS